jgi:V8-like Glu-specific endopeptidase
MKYIAPVLAFLMGGCAQAHPSVDPREFAHRITTERSVCSATAVSADEIETAAHCLAFKLVGVDGAPAKVVSSYGTGIDRIRVKVAGITFTKWAAQGKARVGDRVRWWGQPLGHPFVYREGVVAQTYEDGVLVDGTVCPGDSGSGLFNAAGELVGVISFMSDPHGCTFVGAR